MYEQHKLIRDGAPSPAFSYGGTAEFRDPIYDGVGPRTSADGSSKLSLNQSGGGRHAILDTGVYILHN